MNNWIINIGAVVLFTAILSLILPNGRLNGVIKSIFSLIIVLIILNPIISIKNSEFSFEDFFTESNIAFQEDYLNFISIKKQENYQENCTLLLEELGVSNSDVDVYYELDQDGNFIIKKVNVNLENSVIKEEFAHIDIIEKIKNKLSSYLQIDIEVINVDEV